MYWLIAGLIIAGATWLFMKHRGQKAAPPVEKGKPAKDPVWGKRIIIPAGADACQAAQKIAGKNFPLDKLPRLPLPDCTCNLNCSCRFESLPEKRGNKERRNGGERRPDLRYDTTTTPRRSGRDRRKKNNNAFNEFE